MSKELKNRVIILTEQYTKCKREKEEIECIEKSKYCVDIPSFNNPTVLMNL